MDPLTAAGWAVQERTAINLAAARGVAVRELSFTTGEPDYMLFVDGKAIGIVEAKPEGHPLTGVAEQSAKYIAGLPAGLPRWRPPLPFAYETTGVETRFTNRLDPEPRSRERLHLPPPRDAARAGRSAETPLAQRLREMPPLVTDRPLARAGRGHPQPRALPRRRPPARPHPDGDRLAARPSPPSPSSTGSSSSPAPAASSSSSTARNLGAQTAEGVPAASRTPDDGRKFTELYNVQHLTSQHHRPRRPGSSSPPSSGSTRCSRASRSSPPDLDERSPFDAAEPLCKEPRAGRLQPGHPHRDLRLHRHRRVPPLDLQPLAAGARVLRRLPRSASPPPRRKQTFGFFNQNLVMEYGHEQAVADGVNVDFDVYRIRTADHRAAASTVDAGLLRRPVRDRQTRAHRAGSSSTRTSPTPPTELDRAVVAADQIRTVARDLPRPALHRDLPRPHARSQDADLRQGRHATPRTSSSIVPRGVRQGQRLLPEDHLQAPPARSPTDLIQPVPQQLQPAHRRHRGHDRHRHRHQAARDASSSCARSSRRVFFEQMKGRGVRVIDRDRPAGRHPRRHAQDPLRHRRRRRRLRAATSPTRRPLERKPPRPLRQAARGRRPRQPRPGRASTVPRRPPRPPRPPARRTQNATTLKRLAGGPTLSDIARGIVDALDPDSRSPQRAKAGQPPDAEPTAERAAEGRTQRARSTRPSRPLATNPALREAASSTSSSSAEQIIDDRQPGRGARGRLLAEAAPTRARGLVDVVRALHRREPGRDHRPPGPLQPALRAAPALRARSRSSPRRSSARPAAGPPERSGTPTRRSTSAQGPRARSAASASSPTSSPSSASPSHQQPTSSSPSPTRSTSASTPGSRSRRPRGRRVHPRAARLARADPRPHRHQPRHRARRLRALALRPARRPRQGPPGVRRRAADAARRAE